MDAIAICIAEPGFRDDIAKRLRAAAPRTTTLCAGGPRELAELLARRKVDLVLADWPTIGDAEDSIGARHPPVLLLVGEDQAIDALRHGAHAVLPRDSDPAQIAAAALAAARGLAVIPPALLAALLEPTPPDEGKTFAAAGAQTPRLTPRELEVLAALADGASNKLIARRLGISFHTAKFHVAALLEKLDADSRTEAVAKGARLGLVML